MAPALSDEITDKQRGVTAATKLAAVAWGVTCHALFTAAVGCMALSLYGKMTPALGQLPSPANWLSNALLAGQFMAGHSFLLSQRGRRLVSRLAPKGLGRPLATTSFGIVASLQLLAVFVLWSPDGEVLWAPRGVLQIPFMVAYISSWVLLVRALKDAGLALQTGYLGWSAVLRGREPGYPPLPTQGLFRLCRQPIYLAFALILITGPVWTSDHLLLAALWLPYCALAPRLKERRQRATHGRDFDLYRRQTPYWFPHPKWRHESVAEQADGDPGGGE